MDKTEIMKDVCEYVGVSPDGDNGEFAKISVYDLEAILDNHLQIQWVSVEDRLPDESIDDVLVYTADKDILNYWPPHKGGYGDLWHLSEVSHWMPRPTPPKDKA